MINCAAYVLLTREGPPAEQLAQLESAAQRVSDSLHAGTDFYGRAGVDFDKLLEVVSALRTSLTNRAGGELDKACRELLDIFRIQIPDAMPPTQ
jgi:hypothetical protein